MGTERAFGPVTFRVAARLENRLLAIDLVSTLVKHVETADDDFRDAITTAFGEAFNNVVLHGYEDRTDGVLDVEADLGASEMTLRLLDTGRSADLGSAPKLDLDELVEGGMGVFMIHQLMDEVRYSPGSPNVLSLTKRTGR